VYEQQENAAAIELVGFILPSQMRYVLADASLFFSYWQQLTAIRSSQGAGRFRVCPILVGIAVVNAHFLLPIDGQVALSFLSNFRLFVHFPSSA